MYLLKISLGLSYIPIFYKFFRRDTLSEPPYTEKLLKSDISLGQVCSDRGSWQNHLGGGKDIGGGDHFGECLVYAKDFKTLNKRALNKFLLNDYK